MNDEQLGAEQLDEDVTDADEALLSDDVGGWRPDQPVGLPFADADVSDESLADRAARSSGDEVLDDVEVAAADEQLPLIVDTSSATGDDVFDGAAVDAREVAGVEIEPEG